tara:strand:- start:1341 stop:1793 length:453 start_codon:yes stop_codon:yes gene_type:complete
MEQQIEQTETNKTESSKTNHSREPLFTDETFNNLTDTLKQIREETKTESKTLFFEHTTNQINKAINDIEITAGYGPTYRNFVNQMLRVTNIEQAKDNIMKTIKSKQLEGYSPDLQTLVNEIMTQENIELLKLEMIERFKFINNEFEKSKA